MKKETDFEKTQKFLNDLIRYARGGQLREGVYEAQRAYLVANTEIRKRLPEFIVSSRNPTAFWAYIKSKFAHYNEREAHLNEAFHEVLAYLEFGEDEKVVEKANATYAIFPESLNLPQDVRQVCNEFNFAIEHSRSISAILLLRRLVPLAIVRKFQLLNLEDQIISEDDYLDTKDLLRQAENIVKEKRALRAVKSYKIVIDRSQHSYTATFALSDAIDIGISVRAFLEDLFPA